MTFAEQFGWTVEQAREARGWSMNQCADKAEISRGYYSEIERGLKGISFFKATRLAKLLDLSLDAFVEAEDRV